MFYYKSMLKNYAETKLIVSVINELILFLNSSGLVFVIIMLILSANNIGLTNLIMVNDRSFIQMEKWMDPIPNPVEHHVSYIPI